MASSILLRTIFVGSTPAEEIRSGVRFFPSLVLSSTSRFRSSPTECSCSQSRAVEFRPASRVASRPFGNRNSALQKLGAWGDDRTRGRRGRSVVTMAIPSDAYWITAFQAIVLPILMTGVAVICGLLLNKKIERDALQEYKELVAKGIDPMSLIPEDAKFGEDDPLYIFNSKDLDSASRGPRIRPVREEPEHEADVKVETVGTASSTRDDDSS